MMNQATAAEPTQDQQIASAIVGLLERSTFQGSELQTAMTCNQWLSAIAQGQAVLVAPPNAAPNAAPPKAKRKASKKPKAVKKV